MKRNIMLTIFALCVILTIVGCKNGYKSIKEQESDENADKSQTNNVSLVEKTSSRGNKREYRSFGRKF